mgnify:CR=1 FL=1
MALQRVVVNCAKGIPANSRTIVVTLTSEEEATHLQRLATNRAKEQARNDLEQMKKAKKALLLSQLNKSVTVQDLLDLGLL